MIRKLKEHFLNRFNSNETNVKEQNDGKNGPEAMANSEFIIKYRRHKRSVPKLSPACRGLIDASETKYDALSYIIHCPNHNTIAVYQDNAEEIKWLPFTPIFPEKSWTESAIIGALLILANENEAEFNKLKQSPPFSAVQLLEILRIQLPQTLSFLTRLIFYVKLKPDAPNYECCNQITSVVWIQLQDLANGLVPKIWGPELIQYARVVFSNFDGFNERIEEFSLDDVYLYSPRDPPRNAEETMLLELNISEKTIEILYNDFLEHCYPCFSLPIESFKHYMSKYGFNYNDERLNSLFLAFNYNKNGYVSFHELLMGLVSIEPNARHQETRIKFIFRFYDYLGKGSLDMIDFEKMISDMFPTLQGQEMQAKLEESLELIGGTVKDDKLCVTFSSFSNAIKTHKFRGTSQLCRSTVQVFIQLTRAFIHKKKPTLDDLKEWKDLSAILIPRTHKGMCKKCKSINFKLANHSVSIDQNGYICNPVRVTNNENVSSKSLPRDQKSIEYVFNPNSISNTFIKLIRDFNEIKGNVSAPRGLMDNERKKLYDMIVKLYNEAKPILKSESRCPNVLSPCYVIGDIHGNIEDLLTLEKLIWKSVPCISANYLFLGDYVDRGKWGLECAIYLIALKMLDTQKITLLRGNHEIRSLQEKYTYKKECMKKYGEYGEKIWQLTNSIFDMLPIAATIDNAIFCTHGGITPNAQTLDQIRKIPQNISDPERQSKIAWELLWSDPCHIQQYLDIIEVTDVNNDFAQEGYLFNQKRGAAFLFNERAANNFLSRNGLSHMIRAHEVPPFGFAHHFNNICTTVFSCSHYCNYDNEASCILVDNGRIRVIRIDTHNNAPATDK